MIVRLLLAAPYSTDSYDNAAQDFRHRTPFYRASKRMCCGSAVVLIVGNTICIL